MEETMNPRTILHVDMDAFFASVEQLDHPEWRGKPVVVGAPPDQRGVIAAASYEARKFGIHSAMPSVEAGRRCPQAIFAPVNSKRYSEVSSEVFKIFERFTPLIEPLSIDEAFLDVTGSQRLFGSGRQIAEKIRQAIASELTLTASVGVASNKFLAKLASDMDKPDGLTMVPFEPEEILKFLAPLKVGRIWGVGKVTQQHLADAGIHTIGQLQQSDMARLARLVGKHGAEHLFHMARGEDTRDLDLSRDEKSMSREHTFLKDCTSADVLERKLLDLVEDVAGRLRAAGKYASLVQLKLRWQNFKTITRQKPLEVPSCDDFTLREEALSLFRTEKLVMPVRLIGFGVGQLSSHNNAQLDLFDRQAAGQGRRERLSHSIDRIRDKFGNTSIRRGSSEPEGE